MTEKQFNQISFWQWVSKCYPNVTIINQFYVSYYNWYLIMVFCPIPLHLCIALPFVMCSILSSSVGAWGMGACSLYLFYKFQCFTASLLTMKSTMTAYVKIYTWSFYPNHCHTHWLQGPQRPWNSVWVGLLVFYPRYHVFVAEKLDADEGQEEAFTVPDRLQEAEVLDIWYPSYCIKFKLTSGLLLQSICVFISSHPWCYTNILHV